MMFTIAARRLLSGDTVVDYPLVHVQDGRIAGVESASAAEFERLRGADGIFHFGEGTLVPAYLDIHTHGCAGHDVMEATSAALHTIGAFLARRGVGAYLPTTVTSTREETLRALSGLAREIRLWQSEDFVAATPLGIHLEGPFLSCAKRGVHRADLLEAPSIPLFTQFWEAAEGQIRLMTIAPELPGAAELIAHATSLGVRSSLGHSDATAAEAASGVQAGACSATHTFNAMRAIGHREPGLAAYVLDQPTLFAELICDGIHVDPLMVRLFLKAKGPDRIMLVTDSMSATGMPDGEYMLGGMPVEVRDGRCSANGVLAGSVLTLERAVRNFVAFTGSTLGVAVGAATANPARLLGLSGEQGELAGGRAANIAVLAPDGTILQTFLHGRPAT
jgi:N-acetylglucosamine-6-phosphate deacetylase